MTFTTLTIITLIAVALWAYIDFNAAKATGRWGLTGVKGVANDIQALKHNAQAKQVSEPERQEKIYQSLNENIIDLDTYRKNARGRRMESHKSLTDALAKLDS